MQGPNQDNKGLIKCQVCGYQCKPANMFAHKVECNPALYSQFQQTQKCTKCGNEYSKAEFGDHEMTCIEPIRKEYQEKLQQSSYNYNYSQIPKHQKANQIDRIYPVQQGQEQLKHCVNCGQLMKTYSQHICSTVGKKCEYCDQQFPSEQLAQHLQICEKKIEFENKYQNQFQSESRQHPVNDHDDANHPDFESEQQQQQMDPIFQMPNARRQPSRILYLDPNNIDRHLHGSLQLDRILRDSLIFMNPSQFHQEEEMKANDFPLPFFSSGLNSQMGMFDQNLASMLNYMIQHGNLDNFDHTAIGGLDKNQQKQLKTIKFKKTDNLSDENKSCVICMSEFQDQEEVIILDCFHRFHKPCIEQWITKNSTCPICKTDMKKYL